MSFIIGSLYYHAWGFWGGLFFALFLSVFTSTLAGCLSFFIGKALLSKCVAKCTESNITFLALSNIFEAQGLKLNLLLRVNPIMPYILLNYGESVTKVKFWCFVCGFAGMFPPEAQLIYICITASNLLDLLNGKSGNKRASYISIGVGVALSIIIGVIVGRIVKKELDKMKTKTEAMVKDERKDSLAADKNGKYEGDIDDEKVDHNKEASDAPKTPTNADENPPCFEP